MPGAGRRLAASIEDLSATGDARLVVRAHDARTAPAPRQRCPAGDVVFRGWLMAMVPWSTPASARRFQVRSRTGLPRRRQDPSRIRLADPACRQHGAGLAGQDYAGFAADCLPLVLLPLWVAVHRGCVAALAGLQTVARSAGSAISRHWPTFPQRDLRSLARAFNDLLGVCASSYNSTAS